MNPPLTLPMLKMEKNFVAVIDKGYPRKPYLRYPVIDPCNLQMCLIGFVTREKIELDNAIELLRKNIDNFHRVDVLRKQDIRDQIVKALWEVADVSNTLDYLFEGLLMLLEDWEDDLK